MQYTHLGRSGLQVSRLCLGTMNFGMVTDEPTSCKIMDAAIEAGINFIDTADVYGGPQRPDMEKGYGISEEIIGRWLAQGGRRERIVLATKVYQPMGPARMIAASPRITFDRLVRIACAGCRQTTSTSTRCTTSIGARPGRRSGKRWNSWLSKVR